MNDFNPEILESAVDEIMMLFDVDHPPVPIELMLERPREGLWTRADLTELTSSFLVMTDRYSPRMSVARLLARHIARCDWGDEHGLGPIFNSKTLTNRFARALMMPRGMVAQAFEDGQSHIAMLNRFELPENDFKMRMIELGYDEG